VRHYHHHLRLHHHPPNVTTTARPLVLILLQHEALLPYFRVRYQSEQLHEIVTSFLLTLLDTAALTQSVNVVPIVIDMS
jgi:hypothetical protein